MKAANKVAYNTGIVYLKLILSIVVGLFTIRLVLAALGETNYGIYALVGGIIGMLSFINATMSHASQRFIAYSLGSKKAEEINNTFNTSLLIHLFLALFLFALLISGGYVMFEFILNIPEESVYAARLVYLFASLSMFVSVITVPYEASMRAHENFLQLSLIELLGTLLHLCIAIYISYTSYNLLIAYGFLMFVSQVLIRTIKILYCRRKYSECRSGLIKNIDKSLIRQMLSFSGWTIISSSGSIFSQQAKGVLLNMFFGVALNAANGITKQITQKLNMVVVSLTEAINPQIVKSEGSGDRKRMLRLVYVAAKFSVFLFAVFAIPVFIELPYLLNLWLKEVPDYVVVFCRLFLIQMFIGKYTYSLIRAFRAIGKIKEVSLWGALIKFATIPAAYLLFKAGMPPPAIFHVLVGAAVILSFVYLYYGKKIAGINLFDYINKVFVQASVPVILSVFISILPMLTMEEGFVRLVTTSLISGVASLLLIRFIGLTNEEVKKINKIAGDSFVRISRFVKQGV